MGSTPFEGGVLEYGTTDRRDTATWKSRGPLKGPPPCPEMPKAEVRTHQEAQTLDLPHRV